MDAFGSSHYVPILFTKAGERSAVAGLDDAVKDAFTPVFVIHPIDWDFDLDQPKKTVDEHLSKLPSELQKAWDGRPAFIDALLIDNDLMADGNHPLEWIVTEAASIGLPLIPVVSPDRSSDSFAAVRNLLESGTCSDVCLRLEADYWPAPQVQQIDALLGEIGAERSAAHLILDLKDGTAQSSYFALTAALESLAAPSDWKTLTVAATAIPQAPPPSRGLYEITRQEWLNYQRLVADGRYGSRRPAFGDYAVAHPDPLADAEPINPRFMQISAKLKYTCEDKWLIGKGGLFKGTGGRGVGGEAIRPVAADIAAHAEFSAGHCSTEEWISSAATTGPTGAPKTWVEVGTRHHLCRVTRQLAES